MQCVVHYTKKRTKYSQLKPLSQNQYERIITAKEIRQKGNRENRHEEQCKSVPLLSFDPSVHGVHLDPCYKQFTKIISVHCKRTPAEVESTTRIKRKKADESGNLIEFFPNVCVFCNQERKSANNTVYSLHKIACKDAMALIKEAAKVKNDEKLLIQIRDVDLIAKELQMHRICYIDYTRIVTLKNKPSDADETEFAWGDFDAVKAFISESILTMNKAISITVLHQIYGTGFGDENEKVYRNKLKKRIIDEYGELLMFLKVDGNTPEVVISSAFDNNS